jgi:hypothetical protein
MYMATITIAIVVLFMGAATAQNTSRDYYKELYMSGGLDRMADEFVCFNDGLENEGHFMIIARSKAVKRLLVKNKQFDALPKRQRDELNKRLLISRTYNKGIPPSERVVFSKDGNSWVTEEFALGTKSPFRLKMTITWQTMRYKYEVENSKRSLFSGFGVCERISVDVPQRGE